MWGSYSRIFSCLCNVLEIVVCHSVLFLLAIVVSVLCRSTACNYPFVIFKLFLTPPLVIEVSVPNQE